MEAGDLVERNRGDESERRGRRVAGPEPDQGARMEIAGRGDPGPALASLAAGLPLRPQPDPFGGAEARQGGDVVVGRAGLGDRADQNKEDAASSVAWWSGRIAR